MISYDQVLDRVECYRVTQEKRYTIYETNSLLHIYSEFHLKYVELRSKTDDDDDRHVSSNRPAVCLLLLFGIIEKLKWLKQVSLFCSALFCLFVSFRLFFIVASSVAAAGSVDGRTCVSKCITFLDGQWHVIINII